MTKEEKIKAATWRVFRQALANVDWRKCSRREVHIAEGTKAFVAELEARGCLAECYGDEGSLEIALAGVYLAKCGRLESGDISGNPRGYAHGFFAVMRSLRTAYPAEEFARRARVVKFDEEKAEAERRAAAEAEKAEAERKEKERQEREIELREAEKRLAEIEKEEEVSK